VKQTSLLVLALALAIASVAAGDEAKPVTKNIDYDAEPERVISQELCESGADLVTPGPTCPEGFFPRHRVVVEDTCNGKPYTVAISSLQDTVDRLRVVNADGATQRPEIFFDARSGATGRGGDIRLVRYDPPREEGSCWKLHRLFRYPTRATLGKLPKGAAGRDSFSVFLGNVTRRYNGLELRVVETFVDRDDAFCCPSFRRSSYFRYRSGPDRYVKYATRVARIKKR
jgi:hypothetical protein